MAPKSAVAEPTQSVMLNQAQLRVCRVADLAPHEVAKDELAAELLGMLPEWTARDWLVDAPDLLVKVCWLRIGLEPLRKLGLYLDYAHWRVVECGSRGGKRRTRVDVDALVEAWVEVLVALSTAHDHDTHSRSDERSDELLGPLLTAPIAQMRDFAARLSDRLEHDSRVPFLVWSSFRRVIAPLAMTRPEGEAIALKTTLAREVAELVEHDLDRGELAAALERQRMEVRSALAAVEAGQFNGWLRREDRIEPCVARPYEERSEGQNGASERVRRYWKCLTESRITRGVINPEDHWRYGSGAWVIDWEQYLYGPDGGAPIGVAQPDQCREWVYKTEEAAAAGARAYCLHEAEVWRVRAANAPRRGQL